MEQARQDQPIGVLGALSTGFDTVTRNLWLLILPAALDVFLWLGPRLGAASLWPMLSFDIPAGLDAQTRLFAQQLQDSVSHAFQSYNWLAWLRPVLFGVPGLMDGSDHPLPAGGSPMVWQVSDPLALLVIILILAIIGIGLGGLYWSLIARQARDGRVDWVATLGKMVVVWPRLIGAAAAIVGAVMAIWLTAAVISLGFGSALGIIGALVVMLALSLIVWLLFYVSFSLHGVVLYDQRVIDAMRSSLWLGRTYFRPTLGLLIAVLVIEAGLGMVWRLAPNDSWLWVIAIGGNAFVVSGLSMATMVFYMDRVPIPTSALAPHPTHSG